MNDEATDPRIVAALRAAARVVVLTGAGVSAESGIPTFRDKQTGLWERFDASELATPYAFERDPALVWGWYEWRRAAVLEARPNRAHQAIAAMRNLVPRFTLITQNVDDLHERAGSRDVLHLHGELSHPYCEKCRQSYVHPNTPARLRPGGTPIEPPRCGACGARIRPGVVWFGESLPAQVWGSALESVEQCEFLISCGSSSLVQPAASLTTLAVDAGATVIQVNPNPTDMDNSVTFNIRRPAGAALPQLIADVWNKSLPTISL